MSRYLWLPILVAVISVGFSAIRDVPTAQADSCDLGSIIPAQNSYLYSTLPFCDGQAVIPPPAPGLPYLYTGPGDTPFVNGQPDPSSPFGNVSTYTPSQAAQQHAQGNASATANAYSQYGGFTPPGQTATSGGSSNSSSSSSSDGSASSSSSSCDLGSILPAQNSYVYSNQQTCDGQYVLVPTSPGQPYGYTTTGNTPFVNGQPQWSPFSNVSYYTPQQAATQRAQGNASATANAFNQYGGFTPPGQTATREQSPSYVMTPR